MVLLDPTTDGLQQIATAIAGYNNVASIGVVSHGDDGVLVLGGTVLDSADLGSYQAALAGIGACLSPGGDIQLFGCDIGAGSVGEAFVQSLSAASGAVVAASSNQTGAADLGGDWNLEITTGELSGTPLLNIAALSGWDHLAATQSVSTLADLKTAIATDSTNGADDTITLTSDITFTGTLDTIGINLTDGHSLTIVGGSHTISGANLTQVLHITAGSVNIQNITITNGLATGAGGSNDTGTVGGVGANALGGGIFNAGNLAISGSTITANKAAGGGGAGGSFSNSGGGGGGGGFGTGLGAAGGTGRYSAAPTAPSAGHGGNGGGTSGGQRGGFGGASAGGGGGSGLGSMGYTDGGAGGTANNGAISIGGGGGGSGGYYPGGNGGAAVGGIYNMGTLSLTTSSVTNNIGAGGGGGGGGAANYSSSGNGGNGGKGIGGILSIGNTLSLDTATLNSLSTGNVGVGGQGGIAAGTGNASGTAGVGATNILCFLSGTLIATPDGDVAVQDLQPGDVVLTASGGRRPIVWIGRRDADPSNAAHQPVRVRAHSFGDRLPARDLLVSPEHALFVDGVLVPVIHLVNNHGIERARLGAIAYHHVMLDRHDVILAEGLPAESMLPDFDYDQFDNAATAPATAMSLTPYARRITQGAQLQAIRTMIRSRTVVAAE